MAVFTVPIERMGEYEEALTRALRRETIDQAQGRAARKSLALLRRETRRAPPASENGKRGAVDTEEFLKGWKVTWRGRITTVENTAPHAPYVEGGRGAGKAPPSDVLLGWVKRNLGLRGKRAKTAAFLIARAIGRRGLAPRLDTEKLLAEIDMLHVGEVVSALDRLLAEAAGR